MILEKLGRNPVFKFFIKIQYVILVVCNLASACIVVYNVIMRYVFKHDFMGTEEILTILMIWMYFIGGACGSYEGSHVSADILSSFIKKEKNMDILVFFQELLSTAVCSIITVQVWKFLRWSSSKGALSTTLKYPLIIPQFALGLGFTLMSIFHIIRFIDAVIAFFPKKTGEEA